MTELEEIQVCLHCDKPECTNCLGTNAPTESLEKVWKMQDLKKYIIKNPKAKLMDIATRFDVCERTISNLKRKMRANNEI